ncbi:MAG: 7TM diverse intracellular signaling domain-containing protein [Bacteroidia bacterium]
MNKLSFILFFLFGFFIQAHASGPILYTGHETNKGIGANLEILEDASGTLTFENVILSDKFRTSTQLVPNMGLSNSVFWVKFTVLNTSKENHLMLMLEQPSLDEVSVFSPNDQGRFEEDKQGEFKPFSFRKYKVPDYIFTLHAPVNNPVTYFIRIHSSDQIQLPFLLVSEQSLFEHINGKNLFSGIYVGLMLVMLLYNLFIYFSVRDKSYLYYVVYIASVLLTQTGLQGYPFQFLYPNYPALAINLEFFYPALVGVTGLFFLHSFIQTKHYTPRLYKFTYLLYFAYLIGYILSLFKLYQASYLSIEVTAILVSIYIFAEALIITRKGYRPARFFLIAWSIFLTGICIFVLKDFEVLPYNTFTRYTMQAGSALEVLLISFGLADRINILKKEKEESQVRALDALRENARIVREQNLILETKVHERTAELETTNKELSLTFSNLKEAQSQLVDAEKMASLGQLTAGIAHEINNPINFVKSNIKSLKRTLDEIRQLFKQYEQIESGPRADESIAAAQKLKKELDMDYSMQEIDELLHGIDDGASRTSEIIKGLKVFSRLDEDSLKTADIHEGLNATLILLNTLVKDKIRIVKEYGSLPPVECYPGKINQVFMNILNNAIHAISEKGSPAEGLITIHSSSDEKNVYISIQDNGIGIKAEILPRIFEPFFSTKDVGQGIGLGLSITHSIIEKHHGKIKVYSEPGTGSEFIISLPIFRSND